MAKTGTPPRWLKHVNRIIVAMNRLGVAIENGAVLTVPGRRSGTPRHTPVSVLQLDGSRYLLAGYPSAEWPRNVRAAAGLATLAVGRRDEPVRLIELDPAAAEPILRAWPERIPRGAKVMLDAGVVPDTSQESFARLAGSCPVFRVEPLGS
jgi:F420H(2)-dependent quinone reductase